MARVLLLSATAEDDPTDSNLAPLREAEESARLDRFRIHSLTADPESADLIVFLEFHGTSWSFEQVRRHPYVRRFRDKCFLYSSNPFVIPFLPGVYTGIEKAWASRRTRSGPYLGRTKNDFTTYTPPGHELPYLFSFMGSFRNAAVRANLATLRHPRSFFQDTAEAFDRIQLRKMDRPERLEYDRRYAELTKASKFVLCPRGLSASSIRLFEAMRMGRVPVILADAWVPPIGPRWKEFSIQLCERDFASVPALLEQRESEAVEMGERARAEWNEWFSEEVLFHRLAELCLDIREKRAMPESLARWTAFLHYLQPFHLRRIARAGYHLLRNSGKSQRLAPPIN